MLYTILITVSGRFLGGGDRVFNKNVS